MSFCNVPEHVVGQANGRLCQWPRGHVVTWTVTGLLPGWTREQLVEVYGRAWLAWTSVSGLKTQFVEQVKQANIEVTSRAIDGPAGVLAEAELPCGNVTPSTRLRCWFDNREQKWVDAINVGGIGAVDLLRVAIHEFGHNLGHGHDTDGRTNSIMDPAVSHLRDPQQVDIQRQIERYGEPVAMPDPTEPPAGDGRTADDIADLLVALADCLRTSPPSRRNAVVRIARLMGLTARDAGTQP